MALLVTSSGLAGLGIGMWIAMRSNGTERDSPHDPPTIQQVQVMALLITQRIEVADVEETALAGRTGGISVALLIKGDFLLGTDLSIARFEAVDSVGHRAVLVLPQPRVTSPRLDHDRTRMVAIRESGLWRIIPEDDRTMTTLINRAYCEGQALIAHAADDPRLLAGSKAQAELVLATFFRAIGWDITIRWTN